MKKLLIAAAISSISTLAFAGDSSNKVDQTFSQLDKNGDGVLMQSEVKHSPLSKMMSSVDSDNDSNITESEFDDYLIENPDMFTNQVFNKMEADRKTDGMDEPMETTTYTEELVDARNIDATAVPPAQMVMEDPGTKTEVVASTEFELLDVDQDGMLTKSEAMQSQMNLDFSDMDSDNNQKITQQEYSEYIEELAEEE